MLNVDWLSRLPAPVRRGLYFSLQRAMGSRLPTVWREFLSWESLGPQALEEQVEQTLGKVLDRAIHEVEYYRALGVPRRGAAEPASSWLQRFPVLSRSTVRDEFPRLVADDLRGEIASPTSVCARRYGWLVVKTGGSTGIPTTVVHDATGRDWGRATRLYALRMSGFPLGTPYFRLWGSEQDLLKQQVALTQRVQRALHAEVPLNAFRVRDTDLLAHSEAMRARPDIHHLMAYVDVAASLAQYLQDRNRAAPRFRTLMACAGTVTAEYRRLLEGVFGTEVIDKYGSRDACDMACECMAHQGLHVFSPNVYLEIVNDHGERCPPGVTGRILVTLLHNRGFPLIRYEIGDLAAWAEPGRCGCGLAFPRLREIQGRQDDLLTTEDGTGLTPLFVRHFVGVSLNRQLIQEWQLEQLSRTQLVFRYIPRDRTGLAENLEALRRSFLLFFGASMQVRFEEVEAIPPDPSGKVRWILNRCRR